MDIVICVSLKDCFIVKTTISQIYQNIEASNIYIITDHRNFFFFPKRFRRRYNITLLDEEKIIPNKKDLEIIAQKHFTCTYRFGWYYQQFLKMGFAQSSYASDFYLIWDSDTIPLNKLSFLEQGKMVFTPKTEYHEAYFETIHAIFGYHKETSYSFIAEHMIIAVPVMQELIKKIQDSKVEGNSWPAKIINATPPNDPNGFSEFETYGTYCHHHYSDKFILRELRTFREAGNIYSRSISKQALRELSKEYDTISLESWNTPRKYRYRLQNNIEKYIIDIIRLLRRD